MRLSFSSISFGLMLQLGVETEVSKINLEIKKDQFLADPAWSI